MIDVFNGEKYQGLAESLAEKTFEKLKIKNSEVYVELEFLEEDEIKSLNKEQRGIDSVTDVLSFPSIDIAFPFKKSNYKQDINPENGCVMLGEIFICLERAKEQAKEYNHTLNREVAFLITHGLLHLLGFDHQSKEDEDKMTATAEDILTSLGLLRDEEYKEEGEGGLDKEEKVKLGYVALVGRPNAGKSTLINALVKEKVAIVSWKPQTTRNRILGIMNTEDAQVMFLDTPGIHAPKNALGKFMMRSLTSALEGVEIIVYLIDGEKGALDTDIININRYIGENKKKVIIAVNKIDHITRERVGEILTSLKDIKDVAAIVPISALKNKNLEALKGEIIKLLNYGIREFDEEIYTDKSMRFMAAEIIREKALRLLDEEIPFGIGVSINKYEERENGIIDIDADLICQKKSHKPIILGKDGSMIKKIATYARQDLEEITGSKIFLTLWVRVKEDWRDDINVLEELGYTTPPSKR